MTPDANSFALPDRLLVVDDHPAVGELIARIGTAAGFAVVIAQRADDFRAQLNAFNPSVITLDLLMPDASGVDLLAEMAARNCTAKVVLMSGAETATLDEAHAAGLDLGLRVAGAVPKPFRAASLLAMFEGLRA